MQNSYVQRLADVLVNYSARVGKDDLTILHLPPPARPLLLELYRAVLQAGGHPVVRMYPEELTELMLEYGSDEQLLYIDPMWDVEVQQVKCHIAAWAEENTRNLTNSDSKRLGRRSAARRKNWSAFMNRAAKGELRWVATQYPTNASAQDAEMSLREYERFVYTAGLLHLPDPVAGWKQQSVAQQRLVDFLQGRKDLRVVAGNGTDLRMSVAERRWINCDGHENFPDGEVFTGPVLDSVEGVVRYSFPAVHDGREVDQVMLKFRAGKVVEASAAKGESFLHDMLDMDAGSRMLGECAIGTNYAIQRYTRNTLFDEKIGGTCHFALGAGYPETGNTNESGLHWDMVVDLRQGGYIEIDGQRVSTDGRFTHEDWPR